VVLGACEGNMPSYNGASGILSDQERVALRKIGVPLTGGAMEGVQAEFADIYGSFCGAGESATLIYSEGQPSFIYSRLANVLKSVCDYDTSLTAACTNDADAASMLVKAGMKSSADRSGLSTTYEDIQRRVGHTLGKISSDNVHKLYGDCLRLSASQIDKFGDCKLLYFLRYGLHAEERKIATVDPAEVGTYVHAVL
jgi:ATP-dependent helicase/nuclease subunit B